MPNIPTMADSALQSNYPYNDGPGTSSDDEMRAYIHSIDTEGILDLDEPANISLTSGVRETRYACKLCIARFGFHASNYTGLPRTLEEFQAHRKEKHNL